MGEVGGYIMKLGDKIEYYGRVYEAVPDVAYLLKTRPRCSGGQLRACTAVLCRTDETNAPIIWRRKDGA